MKKLFFLILILLLIVPMFVSADNEKLDLTIGAGTPGASWHVIATVISGLIEEEFPGSRATVIPGGGPMNVSMIDQGQVDLGVTYNNIVWLAQQGMDPFDKKIDVSVIAGFIPYALHVVVNKNTGIKSWDQIIEEKYPLRISVGRRGTTGAWGVDEVLKAGYGIEKGYDIFSEWGGVVEFLNYPDSISQIRDGRLDAMVGFPDMPSGYILEVMEARPMTLLSLNDEVAQKIVDKTGFVKHTIPPNMYKGQTEGIPTVGAIFLLAASPDLPEDVVYRITKTMCENREKFIAAVSSMTGFTAESAWQNIGGNLHPGAERYYKEIGAMN